ncbi:MAG: hypothetical protein GQ475_05955 [Methylococcaceae bacterium]|nr:hypothetical protein [Methylococcaceae bacterium]
MNKNISLWIVLSVFTGIANADLPISAQIEQKQALIIQALKDKSNINCPAVIQNTNELEQLTSKVPTILYFYRGRCLSYTGNNQKALQDLDSYFLRNKKKNDLYQKALVLYSSVEAKAQAEAMRKRERIRQEQIAQQQREEEARAERKRLKEENERARVQAEYDNRARVAKSNLEQRIIDDVNQLHGLFSEMFIAICSKPVKFNIEGGALYQDAEKAYTISRLRGANCTASGKVDLLAAELKFTKVKSTWRGDKNKGHDEFFKFYLWKGNVHIGDVRVRDLSHKDVIFIATRIDDKHRYFKLNYQSREFRYNRRITKYFKNDSGTNYKKTDSLSFGPSIKSGEQSVSAIHKRTINISNQIQKQIDAIVDKYGSDYAYANDYKEIETFIRSQIRTFRFDAIKGLQQLPVESYYRLGNDDSLMNGELANVIEQKMGASRSSTGTSHRPSSSMFR